MAEEQGQAAEQPRDVFEQASAIATGILQSEGVIPDDRPRDEQGKFKAKEEAKPEGEVKEEPAEEQPAEQAEEEAQEEQVEIRKHKLTVKSEEGEDVELEVDDEELKRGYMMEKSYRQKTAQIAREKEAIQSKIKEATEGAKKELDEKLQLAEQAIWHTLAPEMQGIDWNKLAQEDPAEWARKYQHVQNVNSKLAQIQQERKKLAEAKVEEDKTNLKKKVDEAVETLRTEIPGWNDNLYRDILRSGLEQGFKSEEVNAIIDPRAIKVLWKARQYDALQKAKPAVGKLVTKPAPKVMKPGSGETKGDPSADKWNTGMATLKKSGRTEDAVSLARLLIASEGKR